MPEQVSIKCSDCGVNRKTNASRDGSAKLPRGWKRTGGIFCGDCWRKSYILRAVTFPVAGPVGNNWGDFRAALDRCWAASTGLANWAVTELAKADYCRKPGDTKLPVMKPLYLYPEARRRFPDMDPQSVVSALHAVESKYRKSRLDVLWRSAAVLPRHRYPVPYPVHNQGWDVRYSTAEDGGVSAHSPLVVVRLNGSRWTLRLRGGPHYRRQLRSFAQIVSGTAIAGELALYRQSTGTNDHRNGAEDRNPGGGRRQQYRVMCKLVAWLPRTVRSAAHTEGTMMIRSSSSRLLTCQINDSDPWLINADHIRRRAIAHRNYLDRVAEDEKQERRLPHFKKLAINESREIRCEKQARRVKSFIQETAAAIANRCLRQNLAAVIFDDTDKSFVPEFPWYQLKQQIKTKLDEILVSFTDASGEVVDEPIERNLTEPDEE